MDMKRAVFLLVLCCIPWYAFAKKADSVHVKNTAKLEVWVDGAAWILKAEEVSPKFNFKDLPRGTRYQVKRNDEGKLQQVKVFPLHRSTEYLLYNYNSNEILHEMKIMRKQTRIYEVWQVQSFEFNPKGLLTMLTISDYAEGAVTNTQSYFYKYDETGNVISVSHPVEKGGVYSDETYRMQYNAKGILTSVQVVRSVLKTVNGYPNLNSLAITMQTLSESGDTITTARQQYEASWSNAPIDSTSAHQQIPVIFDSDQISGVNFFAVVDYMTWALTAEPDGKEFYWMWRNNRFVRVRK